MTTERGRSPSPRHRNGSYSRGREDSRRRDGDRDSTDDRSRRNGGRRDRARADDYFDGEDRERRRERSKSADRQRDKEREDRRDHDRPRRPSPEYSEYRRPSPPRVDSSSAPWHEQQNMYPNRRDRPPHTGHGGNDYMESRRQQRESSTFTIWPPSPKAPSRSSPSPDSKRHKHSKKRHRRDETPSSDDSEEERRHRERRSKKKHRKEKDLRYESESEEDRRSRRRSKSRTASEERHPSKPNRTLSPAERPPSSDHEDEWVEKPTAPTLLAPTNGPKEPTTSMAPPSLPAQSAAVGSRAPGEDSDEEDDEVGPQPLYKASASSKRIDERQYGGALLRGEGSAMAAFLKDGTDVRIPRRGEIGLTSDEIAAFESVGYVMSGSRHKRMNAVRMRKENQVISAEEKRGILKLQQEERARREAILREEFQELVNDNLKSQGTAP
ncbi:hypothetical protein NM688_g7521 [Phlebia brevispora]|uniref:Uncharacterized protein n=1 Tax=Phlebia brevispora TaxID=194682 RepID=A0ACC1S4F8_9APHY|nr:hypothetical protein NM688_g7521 [Phlebia brevispora]